MTKEEQIDLLRQESTTNEIQVYFSRYSEQELLNRYHKLSILCLHRIKPVQKKFLPGGDLSVINLWILKEKRLIVLIFQKYYHKNI